ncbi:MAG: aspartate-semialdehyde dehydrogenase, partial [Oscillospiraceae bacterium]|nr:aspartate-semialdehyde dehydrogenase [Oscillospiraceae bacterium]
MKQYRVGILGATGMVGQRFALLLADHPWFEVTALAASARSAGKTYGELMADRWQIDAAPCPESLKDLMVYDAFDVQAVAAQVDFVFCAVDISKAETKALEDAYALAECPVVSNNSAHRGTADVPMIIPELNANHSEVIAAQRKRLGTQRGFVAVKSNCSLQSYVPALYPLADVQDVAVCTYQAISGAGKTFDTWPEMLDNVIP